MHSNTRAVHCNIPRSSHAKFVNSLSANRRARLPWRHHWKACIVGAQPTGICKYISSRSPRRFSRLDCHISLYRLKIHPSEYLLDIYNDSMKLFTLSNLWNVFISKLIFTCVLDVDVLCLHSSTIVTSSRVKYLGSNIYIYIKRIKVKYFSNNICIYIYIMNKHVLNKNKILFTISELPKRGPTYSDKWLIHGPNIARTHRHKAWNTPADYPSWELYTRDFHSNKLNAVFSRNVRG